jgi:hypothetical protein
MAFPLLARRGDRARVLCGLILTHAAILILFGALAGCSHATPQAEPDAPNDAAVNALNVWWKEFTASAPPMKAGTVTPAHTIISSKGRVYQIGKHVQTKQEAEQEAEDARFLIRKRALVQGFSVRGKTVTVMTNLTRDPVDVYDAEELCHDLGAFVWANNNRHFGLQNIKISGPHGELLSSRSGLSGKVQ